MGLFNRNKQTDNPIPDDLKPYYANNSGVRRWLSPVLRGLLLLVLVGLLVWGGIWSVNKIIDRSNRNASSSASRSQDTQDTKGQTADNKAADDVMADNKQPATPAPAPTPAPTPTTPAPAPTPVPTPAPAAPTPTPGQGSGSSSAAVPAAPAPVATGDNLANTGPKETLLVFAAVSVLAAAGYRLFGRRLSR